METSPVIKILVVGDAGVGKTSVIQRYVGGVCEKAEAVIMYVGGRGLYDVCVDSVSDEPFPKNVSRLDRYLSTLLD